MAAYGDTGPIGSYEEDHLIPLELGGAPSDPKNLWPEPGASPNPKDAVEDAANRAVCDGSITLIAAQQAMAANWITFGEQLGVTHPPSSVTSPTPTTPAATSPPVTAVPTTEAPSTTTCTPLSSSGHCYKPGETCPDADHGLSGVGASGQPIKCENNDGWRWESA